MHPYWLYASLEFVPVVVLSILSLSIIFTLKINCCHSSIFDGLAKLAKGAFGQPLGLFNYQQDLKIDEVYIEGKRVPRSVLIALGIYLVMVIVYVAMVFWDIFFIEESSDCDATIDCFASTENNIMTEVPITNCSLYDEDPGKNVTIQCFKFVYRLVPGLAAVGGMLTMSRIVTKLISVAFLYVYSCVGKKYCCTCCCKVPGAALAILQFVLFFLLFIVTAVIPYFIYLYTSFSPGNIFQTIIIMLTIDIAFIIPWGYFVPINANSIDDESSAHYHAVDENTENVNHRGKLLIDALHSCQHPGQSHSVHPHPVPLIHSMQSPRKKVKGAFYLLFFGLCAIFLLHCIREGSREAPGERLPQKT